MELRLRMSKEISIVLGLLLTLLINACGQSMKVDLDDLLSDPQSYQRKEICTEGVYASGFEINALGASTYQEGDTVYLTEPVIWIEGADIRSSTDCFKTDTTPPVEFCQVTVCGFFETGGNYGHLGAHEFQIRRGE